MEIIRHYLSAVAGWVGINIWPYSQQEILHDPQAFDRFMSELIGSSTCSLSRLNLLGEDASKRFVEQMHGYLGIDVAYVKKLLGNTIYDTMAASDGGIDVDEDGCVTALRVYNHRMYILDSSERASLTFDIQALKFIPRLAEFDLRGTGVTGDLHTLDTPIYQLTHFGTNINDNGVAEDTYALE